MPVTQASLGEACEVLRSHLQTELAARVPTTNVMLGNLATAAGLVANGEAILNLLVYRVEPDGSVFGHNDPTQPWMVRLHVLVTPFHDSDTAAIGSDDLHLLGTVAAALHRTPVLPVSVTTGGQVALQVVPEAVSVETLNQLWSVQGEVGFRPSLAYDIGLVPIATPDVVTPPQPLVGDVRLDVLDPLPEGAVAPGRGTPGGLADLRYAGAFVDDTTPVAGENEAQRLAREAIAHREPARLRVFALGGARLDAFTASVTVVADVPRVRLVWEVRTGRGPITRALPANDPVVVDTLVHRRLPVEVDPVDPGRFPGVQVHQVELPAPADRPAGGAYQLVLRAVAHDAAAPIEAPALAGRPVMVSVYDPAVP